MQARKKEEAAQEPFCYETEYRALAQRMSSLHMSRIAEMPRIELYLDQVLSLVTMELAPLYDEGEKFVTGSMVNNYVKQGVMPPPTRKRYTRRHVAYLLFVCTLKKVLPIAQIAQLLRMCGDSLVDYAAGYDELAGAMEETLHAMFPEDPDARPTYRLPDICLADPEGRPVESEIRDLLRSSILLVANKVYLEKTLALEAKRSATEASGH